MSFSNKETINKLVSVKKTCILYVKKRQNPIYRIFFNCRSSHQRCSIKKDVLKKFTNFTGKHLCQSLCFNKLASLRPTSWLKKRLWHRCFPINFVKFSRTPILENTSGRLFLYLVSKAWKQYEISVSPPFCWGWQRSVPNFEKGEIRKKMSA